MLKLKTFVPAADKVRQVEFHPVQPWVVSSTKSNQVVVWDWKTGQVLHDITFSGTDDETTQEHDISRLHLRDPVFAPNPSAVPTSVARTHSGHVKDVRFLDADVAQAYLTSQHRLVNGAGTQAPQAEHITALHGQRLLVVACEHKVIVYDMLARKSTEIGRTALDSKAPTCLSFVFMAGYSFIVPKGQWVMTCPLIAVGCNDGVVRIVHLTSLRQVVRLVDGHKTPVVQLYTTLTRGHPYEQLVAGHQSGNTAMWEPFTKALSSGVDIPAKMDFKAHEKPVVGIVQVATCEDPELLTRLIYTVGQDNRVQGFDPAGSTIKATSVIKLDAKALATCVAYSPRGFSASGTHTLLVGTEVGLLMGCHPTSGSVQILANLANIIPCGAKKAPKIYSVSVHPSLPQYVVLGTNVGSVLLAMDSLAPLCVAPLPLRSAAHAHSQEEGGAAGVLGEVTYMSVVGDSVYCNTIATLPSDSARSGGVLTEVRGKLKIATGKPSGRALLTSSGDGTYVGVTWPSSRLYAIYRQGAASWDEVASGSGTALAWHSSEDRVAILEDPPPAALAAAVTKPPKKLKGKEAEAAAAAKVVADKAAAAAPTTIAIQIRQMSGRTMASSRRTLRLDSGDAPAFVSSGPLLAVTLKRQDMPGGDLVAGADEPNVLQFYDWESLSKVGPEMTEPLILAWDPSLQMAALAYSGQVVLLRVQPTFSTIATVAVSNASCLEWSLRQLYISTVTHVYCAFVSTQTPKDSSTASWTQVVTLATPDGVATPTTARAAGPGAAGGTLLPAPAARPAGPLLLLGPREGYLWTVNAHAQALALPLLHTGLRCMCLAASGDLHGSLALATQMLSAELHDALAAFYLDMDGPLRGAGAALNLPGLSLPVETRIRFLLRQWPQALECCEALLAGFRRRPAPGTFVAAASAAAFAPPVGSGLGVATVGVARASAVAPANNPAAGLYGDAPSGSVSLSYSTSGTRDEIDWTQPLRQAAGAGGGLATAATEVERPPMPHATHEAVDLTLELLAVMVGSGMYDVCKHISNLVLKYASDMDGMQTARLASCMADCGMKQELPQLVHRMVPGADGVGQEAAGLLAALLSGHTSLAQDVLRQGGAAALAAAQASAHRLEAAVAVSQEAWKQQLRASAGAAEQGVAAHQSFAYLSVK